LRPLRESLAGDRIRRVLGIVNGTTNYILTRMAEDGASFADALAEAQRLGYAEADPTADVEGYDAAAKAAIIATIARAGVPADVPRRITQVTGTTCASARARAAQPCVAEESGGEISVRVHPAMVPVHHPLAAVRDSFNAVFIEADAVGELMLYGRGAGGNPTASAVLGDLVDAARNLVGGARGATIGELVAKPIRPMAEVESPFYVLMEVADRPGVLHAISGEFARFGVSIKSMEQRGAGDDARLVFITHRAREADMVATLDALRHVDVVHRVGSVIRVAGEPNE
jgi:homoserine dehydrogenase